MNLDNTKEAAQMLQSITFAGPQQDTTIEVYFSFCLLSAYVIAMPQWEFQI